VAGKEEIIGAIREGMEQVERTFGALSDEQLQTRVHDGDGGWTAKEILAHLAGRARGYALMSNLAAGVPFAGGFNVQQWNQERVAERTDKSRDELLAEFLLVHENLIAFVETLDDATLAVPIQLGPQPAPLGEVLRRSGGMHSVMHAREVGEALGGGA
jgi:hypothetical protein